MPLDSPDGSQDEAQERAAAPEGGAAAFDGKTLKALLRMHGEDLQRGGSVVKNVSKALSLSEKEVTKAITARMRTMREEVQYLLGEVGSAVGGEEIESMRRDFADDAAPLSLQQIVRHRDHLAELLAGQGKNAGELLEERFKERKDSPQHREQERVIRSIEVVFLVDDIASNRKAKVREALEGAPSAADPESALAEMRNRLFTLLSPKKRQEFSLAQKLDVLREEVWEEREQREYDRLSVKILGLFGRGKGEAPFHTQQSLAKALREEEGMIKHILGRMNQEGQIGFMMGAAGEEVYMCRDKKIFSYMSDELIAELDPAYFDRVGAFLRAALDQGDVVDRAYLEDHAHELKLPSDVAAELLDCYVDAKRLRRTKDRGYHMPEGEEKTLLSSMVFDRISLAQQFYELAAALDDKALAEVSEVVTWETIEREYKKFRERQSVNDISLATGKPSMKMYPFTEIQLGHMDLDNGALRRRIEELKALPLDERPDQIIVSGALFGRFKHWEKDKHKMRVYEADTQLRHAKFVLDELRSLGIPIVYNMSDNDALIVKEYTYDAVGLMESLLKGGGVVVDRSTKRHLARGAAYWQFEQAQRSKAWPQHYAFQWDVVLPYMLRSGRHLHSAEEVQELHGEEPIEEYLLLLYAYKKRKDGESLEQLAEGGDKLAKLALKVLEIDNIPFHGEEQKGKVMVTSDFVLHAKTQERTRTVEEKHSWRQSGVGMVQDPMKAARAIYDQLIADGEEVPDMVIGENEQHAVGVLKRHNDGHVLIATTPGLQTFNRHRSSYTRHGSDKSERMAWARGERFIAGTTSFEITDDDRYKIEFFNDKFMDIAAKTKERVIVVNISDLQLGSVTSDFDTAIKCFDYVLYHLLADPKARAVLFLNGDHIQGWNYPKFPIENARMGLVGVGRQQKLLVRVLENMLSTLPRELKSRMEMVKITDGNHEWNSPGKRAEIGLSHSLPIEMAFRHNSEGLYKTELCDYDVPVVTKDGSRFVSSTAYENVQGYGFVVQHILQERGGKGSGGGPPVYQARELIKGCAPHMPGAHVLMGGHYHEPNYLMYDNKLGIVNGSWARISGYEWWLGYCPTMGTVAMHVGGGKPPMMEVITAETLYKYKMQGYYKDEPGCDTDKGHDPHQHTFASMLMNDGRDPMSGVQKKLIKDMQELKKERPLFALV